MDMRQTRCLGQGDPCEFDEECCDIWGCYFDEMNGHKICDYCGFYHHDCTSDSDCCTGDYCIDGVCWDCATQGVECTIDDDCCSDYCEFDEYTGQRYCNALRHCIPEDGLCSYTYECCCGYCNDELEVPVCLGHYE